MAIPSVKQFSQEPGGGLVTAMRGSNALTRENLENQIKGAEADYAPYTQYANAKSKIAYSNMIPYQIQATLMSNPMLWMALKDNPEAINALVKNFSQSVPTGENVTGNVHLPEPSQRSQGLMGALLAKLQMSHAKENQNPMSGSPQGPQGGGNGLMQPPAPLSPTGNGSPTTSLVPATGSGAAAVAGNAMAPGMSSPFKDSVLYADPNKPNGVGMAPSAETKQKFQTASIAAQRVAPMLESLANGMGEFLTLKGKAKNVASGIGNFLDASPETLKKWGLDADMPSRYAAAQSKLNISPADLLQSYGLVDTVDALHRLGTAMEPVLGEGAKGYKARVLQTLEDIQKNQIGKVGSTISQGFPVGGTEGAGVAPATGTATAEQPAATAVTNDMERAPEKPSAGSRMLAKGLEMPEFSSREEALKWFHAQPQVVQDAVRLHLKGKR